MALIQLGPLPPRTTKADLLRFLAEQGGLDRRLVGRIDLHGRLATVEVPDGWQARLLSALDGAALHDRRVSARPAGPRDATGEDHFTRLAGLLEVESQAEARQIIEQVQRLPADQAERGGLCLTDLAVREEYGGLGGRFLLTLAKRGGRPLPWTRLQAGAPVLLSQQGGAAGEGWRGVVCERTEGFVRVAFNEPPETDGGPAYRLDLSGDEAARLRMRQAL